MKTEVDLKLRRVFTNMKVRCNNINSKDYKNYGGRGIKICKEWLNNPKLFYQWAIDNGYEIGLQIDRKNNDLDYNPKNCRWVTKNTNNRNTRQIKLNEELVREIRYGKYKNIPRKYIAKIIGCSISNIDSIFQMKSWKDI